MAGATSRRVFRQTRLGPNLISLATAVLIVRVCGGVSAGAAAAGAGAAAHGAARSRQPPAALLLQGRGHSRPAVAGLKLRTVQRASAQPSCGDGAHCILPEPGGDKELCW
jgi:hypothetical protein